MQCSLLLYRFFWFLFIIRKPRFLSEPLPSRGDTPPPSTAHESGPHLPPTAQPDIPPHSAFPLTPISAIGEGPIDLRRGSISRSEQIPSLNGSHQVRDFSLNTYSSNFNIIVIIIILNNAHPSYLRPSNWYPYILHWCSNHHMQTIRLDKRR